MKPKAEPRKPRTKLGKAAARGLKRAAAAARVTARRYGTRIHVTQNGRIVALDPNEKSSSP